MSRGIREDAWAEAKMSQFIPGCGNDNKVNHIHLNVLQTVASVAAAYFEPEERPLVLEIDICNL